MPDNDRFPRSLGHRWRRSFRLALAGDDPEHVGAEMTTAMAGALRDTAGCPGTAELAVQVRDAALFGADDIEQTLAAFSAAAGHTVLAAKISDEALAFIETRPHTANVMTDDDVRRELAEGGLRRLADAAMFSPGRDQLFEKLGDSEKVAAYERRCVEEMQLGELADSLIVHPDGQGLRAPRRRDVPPTANILDEDFS